MSKIFQASFLLFTVLFFSCGGGGGASRQVTVSWSANNDKVVNTTGGGYTLYYSQQSGFSIDSASTLDVPYVSGATAPTSAVLSLSEGTWYLRIAAYGVMNGTAKASDVSSQLTVNVGGQ